MFNPIWELASGEYDLWQVYVPSPQDIQAFVRWVSWNLWAFSDFAWTSDITDIIFDF